MRWDSQRLAGDSTTEGQAAPALFERAAITRTFDTPGFRGMTFHEVHAKTIISRVPEASRVPFRWTINPYRGCSHACRYCLGGDTPVLMADGRHKPISELQVGDRVYGTVRTGRYRRYVPTTVQAHWQTVKPAYRITLADGTTLIASGDHRFLTERGWKHVTGTEQGHDRRPHLTLGNALIGVGAFAEQPKESADYRRGYLGGMIRGDGEDFGALARAGRYLADLGIRAADVERLLEWRAAASSDWQKGFLAGIFDAGGSFDDGGLQIFAENTAALRRTTSCLAALAFQWSEELAIDAGGVLRLRGGLAECLRFFHATDPAAIRKRLIDDLPAEGELKIVSIKPLSLDMPMYDITTGTGDFIANGVISHNCFARNTHTYLDFDAGHDFDSQIVVKVNAPALLRKELGAPRWRGEHIAMGTNVDCYQRAEGRYELMPGILRALIQAANPFSILTKGTLILRDIDLLAEAAEVTEVGLNVSAGIIDKELSRLIESGAPAPERRLAACAALNERGLPCGVLMGPVVPYLSDSPAQLERAVRLIAAAGGTHVSPIVLHLRPGAREWFLAWLREAHPELVGRYAELYRGRAYAPAEYQKRISELVAGFARKHGVGRATPRSARRLPAANPAPAAASPAASSPPVSRPTASRPSGGRAGWPPGLGPEHDGDRPASSSGSAGRPDDAGDVQLTLL
jgi:DNA repair photolyase